MELFYTDFMEWGKALLYVLFIVLIAVAAIQFKRKGNSCWRIWIHAVILVHFIIGGVYSGLRMLTTDPFQDMLVRRIFAGEAWFCFSSAAFYFLLALYIEKRLSE